jgi:hypothetical protein
VSLVWGTVNRHSCRSHSAWRWLSVSLNRPPAGLAK